VVPAATASTRVRARFQRPAPDVVLEWRFDELERAGLDAVLAIRLALDLEFDVAAMRTLVSRGCDAALAVRILG
jgi:hypothetical protein